MTSAGIQEDPSKKPFLKHPGKSHKAVVLGTFFDTEKPQKKFDYKAYLQANPPKPKQPKPKEVKQEEQSPPQNTQKNDGEDQSFDILKRFEHLVDFSGGDDDEFGDFDFGKYIRTATLQGILNHPLDVLRKSSPGKGGSISPTKKGSQSPVKTMSSPSKGYTFFDTKKVEPPLRTKLKEKSQNSNEAQMQAYKDLVDNEIKNLHSVNYDELARIIYNKEIFIHVCRTPEFIMTNAKSLGSYLSAPCKSELQRVWVLFLWVAQNLSINSEALLAEEIDKPQDEANQSPSKSVSVGQGYAMVFKNVGKEMGLKIRIVEGYCKGFAYPTGAPFKAKNHQWNAVEINGKWHLVDCMMGSGHIDMSHQYVKELDLFYFLTSPEKLLMTHFPEQPYWQLLEYPVSKETFEKAAHVYPKYFDFCIELLSHKTSIVEITTEETEFSLRTLTNVQLFAELCKDNVSNRCESAIFSKYKGDGIYSFDVLFPSTGTFFLRIYGSDINSRNKSQHLVISYKLTVKFKMERKQTISPGLLRKYPRVAPKYFHDFNVEMLSHNYGILFHQTQQQPLMIALSCAEDVVLTANLCRAEDNEIIEGNMYTEAETGFFEFHIIFPKAGNYFVPIYANYRGSSEKFFILEYPVTVITGEKSTRTFIEMNMENCLKFQVKPQSHRFNIKFEDREETEPKPLSIYFTADMFVTFSFNLFSREKPTVPLKDLTWYDVEIKDEEVLHRVDVIFPKGGTYTLDVYARYMFDETEPTEEFSYFVMRYKIEATVKNRKPLIGFPTSLFPVASLHSPMTKYLLTRKKHWFSVSIPKKPTKVIVMVPDGYGNEKVIVLTQKKDPDGTPSATYEGEVQTNFTGDITVYAQLKNSEVPIKVFKFVSVDQLDEKHNANK